MSNMFSFRSGRHAKGIKPQTVGEELERLRAEKGTLTPESVVEDAAREDSPLHSYFTWDDAVAGHQHRLQEARKLLVSVRITNSPTIRISPAFVSVSTPDVGRNYVPVQEALSDAQIRERVMDDVRRALEAIQRRYAGFQDACALIDVLKKQVG
jgi:hypothetical protein